MRKKKYIQKCVDCNHICDNGFHTVCPKCGGMTDFNYNLDKVKINNKSNNPNIKYFDLLPIIKKENLVEVSNFITPLVHAKELGKKIGHNKIFLKNETVHPTKTTKDRMATIGLSYFKELGIKEFVLTSTGNSGISYAIGSLLGDFKLHLFIGQDFINRLELKNLPNTKRYIVKKDFTETGKEAKKFAKKNNIVFEGGAFNPARREGLKITYLEAFDQMIEKPDYIFQAVSSGMGILGAHKGIKEFIKLKRLNKIPKMICCQQKSCNPMIQAWKDNSSVIIKNHIIKNPKGVAKAILRGDPSRTYPYLYKIIKESGGCFIDVNNKEIEEAKKLAQLENLNICYAAAVALASAIKLVRNKTINNKESVLVNITGGERT